LARGLAVQRFEFFQQGALLLRRTGSGSLILCTYPVERMAALTPQVNPDDTVTLYDALARHAGVRRPVTVADQRVACDTLIRDDGVLFAVLASHAAEALTVRPCSTAGSWSDWTAVRRRKA
jgi:hypothetical protein